MRKLSQDLQILSEMEIDQLDIAKIKEQRQVVARIQGTLRKKDEQVEKLKSLLQKYQQYQQKYTSLKVQLAERTHLMAKKDNQCKMLKRQLQDLLQQHHQIQQKMKQYDSQRQSLIRERHTIETANKQIENTFKQYQSQCRKRQNALNFDLERAYQRIKESNSRIDQLELIAEQKKELDEKIKQNQKRINKSIIVASQQKLKTPQHNSNKTQNESQSLIEEITKLREELLAKQQELTANRVLNYELTLEYDNSITRITGLQTQVSKYRRQNNELKKILSLLRQQEKCKQIQEKYTLRNNTNFGTPCSDEEGGSQCSEDALLHKHFIPKTTDAVAIHS